MAPAALAPFTALEPLTALGSPAALEALPPLVGTVAVRGLAQLDRLYRWGLVRTQQERHRTARRHTHGKGDGDQTGGAGAHDPAPPPAERRKGPLMVIALEAGHAPPGWAFAVRRS